MTPRERWLQRILHARGVRPVGHAAPAEDDQDDQATAPVVPVQAQRPAPGWPPAGPRRVSSVGGGRLPSPGQTITLGADEDDEEPDEETAVVDEDQADEDRADEGQDQADADADADEDQDEDEEAPAAPPKPGGPVAKIPAGAKPVRKAFAGRTGGGGGKPKRAGGKSPKDDPSLRIAVFNLTAAGVGYGLSLSDIVNGFLTGAEQAARGVFELVLAVLAGWGAWWVTRNPGVRAVLPYPFIARPLIVAGCAEIARRQAPAAVDWLNQYGTRWGLGPDAVSLLITSGGLAFAAWWCIDRRLRRFHWVVRWLFRVPLATVVVCTLRYGNPVS